jgi:hypothetical protein
VCLKNLGSADSEGEDAPPSASDDEDPSGARASGLGGARSRETSLPTVTVHAPGSSRRGDRVVRPRTHVHLAEQLQRSHLPEGRIARDRRLPPRRAHQSGSRRCDASPVFDPSPPREPPPVRRREDRHSRRHRSGREVGPEGPAFHRDRLPPRTRAPPGLHGRAGVVDLAAMREGVREDGRRPQAHQPAGALRSRDRPLGAGRRVRHGAVVRSTTCARVRAQPRALPVPQVGPAGFDNFRVVPPGGHRAPGQPRVPGARVVWDGNRVQGRWLYPTRWSAPTRTPR